MAGNSEQIGLTDSLLNRMMEPGYLPDVTALTMPGTYQGIHYNYRN